MSTIIWSVVIISIQISLFPLEWYKMSVYMYINNNNKIIHWTFLAFFT